MALDPDAIPKGRADLRLLGDSVTRTPYRPNRVSLTLVELLRVEENAVTVCSLGGLYSKPILDIKPFDYRDMVDRVRVLERWRRLERKEG